MNGDRFIEFVLWVLSLVLAIVFFYNGASKIMESPYQVAQFAALGLPGNLLIAVGVLECVAGLMLTIPRLTLVGGILLAVMMLVNAGLYFSHDNSMSSFRAVVLVVMLAGICYLRFKRGAVRK